MQAWSAAALPFMLTELLGLSADGFARRLFVRRPLLPDGVDTLALHGIRAGGGTAALRFTRTGDTVATEVLEAAGIEVAVE